MIPNLSVEDTISNDCAVLLCPACGFNYLHHANVHIFARHEDAEDGLHVAVHSGDDRKALPPSMYTTRDLDGNPSSRRGGIRIEFWCEGCRARPHLTISQHKGQTLIEVEAKK